MEVHLIRHTPIDFSNKICYGRLDVPLSKNYEDDIMKIKKQLLNKYDIVYSSPIKRCTILAKDLNVSEIGLGCMSFAGFYDPTTKEESFKCLDKARDSGISFLNISDIL